MMIRDRVFTFEDQNSFAAMSGDRNPLHIDRVWAEANYPGKIVVHGMHVVCWLLEEFLKARLPQGLAALTVVFIKPILIGDKVAVKITGSPDRTILTALVDDELMVRIDVGQGPLPVAGIAPPPAGGIPLAAARSRTLAEIDGLSGIVNLPPNNIAPETFPHLTRAIGSIAVSGLAGLSTLVGMECPGVHGIFAELDVSFPSSSNDTPMRYRVIRVDRRFSRITMTIDGHGIAGKVIAAAGNPDSPPGADTIIGMVKPNEFADQSPLVIGGSSGLGAVTAMLLAAGGAKPILTVNNSLEGADHIRQRIENSGGTCDIVRMDVTAPAAGLAALAELSWKGSQIYYFATPRIFRRRQEVYQAKDLRDFTSIYVDGFYEVIRNLIKERDREPLSVFYPSSIALDQPLDALLEYALAKEAGERVCAAMEHKFPFLRIHVKRLPRIESRQTKTFVKVTAAAPAEVMLPIIREIQTSK